MFCHHKIQQALTIGPRTALRIQHTRHRPTHIYRCNIGADEANLDVGIRLMAASENRREHRSMEFFDLGSAHRTHSTHVCKIRVLREYRRERVSIMPVPRIHEAVHQPPNCLPIKFCSNLTGRCEREQQKQKADGGYLENVSTPVHLHSDTRGRVRSNAYGPPALAPACGGPERRVEG